MGNVFILRYFCYEREFYCIASSIMNYHPRRKLFSLSDLQYHIQIQKLYQVLRKVGVNQKIILIGFDWGSIFAYMFAYK